MFYEKLNDKNWLLQEYSGKLLSCSEISNSVGCSKDGVRAALLRHSIPLRSSGESIHAKNKRIGYKSRLYENLNNEQWLREQYLVKNKSTQEIASIVGADSGNSVRQALIRKGIEVRNKSDGLTIKRTSLFVENKDVINGCLLGDGFMRVYNRESDESYPAFYKRNKYYDHVLWVGEQLMGSQAAERIRPEIRILNDKEFPCYLLHGFCEKMLLDYYRKWYPKSSGFKKVVPHDLEINEKVILNWFLDDGTSYRYRLTSPTKQVIIWFCSESFIKEDQEWLCDKMNEKYNLKAKVHVRKGGTGWRIKLPQSKTADFFEIIGPPPIKSLAYKWK